jgi:N,N'-diacetyllegionaminate synthase
MHLGAVELDHRVLVIAEVGNNHEGDLAVARKLVDASARAGADAVKFQIFRTEHYVSSSDAARFARLKAFELGNDAFRELSELARVHGLLFVATPFDLASADLVAEISDAVKIASGDCDFVPLLERAADHGKPMLVSTGISDLERVGRAVTTIRSRWGVADPGLALLHCVSSYPTPEAEANVGAIRTLASAFPDCTIGYSDHTIGSEAAVLAVAAGARVIEKHITLDTAFSDFRDHQLSADPEAFAALVASVRRAELLLGTGEKRIQPSEEGTADSIRRSIVSASDLPAGHRLTVDDLTWTRPAGGLAPGHEAMLVGRPLVRAVRSGEQLNRSDVG